MARAQIKQCFMCVELAAIYLRELVSQVQILSTPLGRGSSAGRAREKMSHELWLMQQIFSTGNGVVGGSNPPLAPKSKYIGW